MNSDPVRVSRIDFLKAIPALRLFEAIPLAFSLQTLVPSLLAAMAGAWIVQLFPFHESCQLFLDGGPLSEFRPFLLIAMERTVRHIAVHEFAAGVSALPRLLLLSVVLAFVAVSVARTAGLRFCSNRRSGAIHSFRHARRSWVAITTGLTLAFAICGFPIVVFRASLLVTEVAPDMMTSGWLTALPGWVGAVLMIVVLTVCGIGWLLSLAAIGLDSCDGPESLSRGICYVLSRFRMTVLQLLLVMMLTYLSAEAVSVICSRAAGLVEAGIGLKEAGIGLKYDSNAFRRNDPFWVLTGVAADTFGLSVFFSGITVCYVLVRQAEDGVSLTEIDGGKSRV